MTIKSYTKPDGTVMVEIDPGEAVNIISARKLGLIGADVKISESAVRGRPPAGGGISREEILGELPAAGVLS